MTRLSTKPSRGRPKQTEADNIESRLLNVALQEFLKHGYGGASVSRIVKQAQMSKTTVYSRFSSKEELFHALMQQQIKKLAPEKVLAPVNGSLNLEEGLKAFANHMLKLSLQGDLMGVNRLMYSESHRFPELAAEAANRNELGVKRISDFIQDCALADGFSCKNPKSVAEVFILMIRGWYIDIMLTNRKVTPRQRKNWVDQSVNVLLSSREQW